MKQPRGRLRLQAIIADEVKSSDASQTTTAEASAPRLPLVQAQRDQREAKLLRLRGLKATRQLVQAVGMN